MFGVNVMCAFTNTTKQKKKKKKNLQYAPYCFGGQYYIKYRLQM